MKWSLLLLVAQVVLSRRNFETVEIDSVIVATATIESEEILFRRIGMRQMRALLRDSLLVKTKIWQKKDDG